MSTFEMVVLLIMLVLLALQLLVLWKFREVEAGARAALQNVQLQLAFISGRIGLRNQDLQAAAVREPSPEDAKPEVIGGGGWNDFEELLDRAERGEVDLEESERAR